MRFYSPCDYVNKENSKLMSV